MTVSDDQGRLIVISASWLVRFFYRITFSLALLYRGLVENDFRCFVHEVLVRAGQDIFKVIFEMKLLTLVFKKW